jgi:hypothetical protein
LILVNVHSSSQYFGAHRQCDPAPFRIDNLEDPLTLNLTGSQPSIFNMSK